MSEFKIEPYSNDIAESLAQMWNESNDQWPGTFTRGVPMTAKRITKWMSEVDYMMNLVVKNGNGKIVGYGNLRDTPNQTGDSCYVPLLNVHPKYQGKSLCRRMLNQMVDYATAHGYQRMTIGTWSGNLKSVPLYKKVGFFWKPGMTVQMENYIPAVRQLPFAQSFFANADWYADFKRELAQVEDDHRHPRTGDMKVYICRWEKDGDFIEAVIDREGQSITGVETPRFAVHAVVDDSYPAQGFRYGISWCLENRQAVPITLTLQVSSDEGIDISFHQTITLAPGEKRRLESSFVCTTDAPPVDFDERWEITPRPRIYTQVTMDKQTFSLGTGLCYQPAVEISVEPEVLSLMPGQERAALIQLKNRVKRPFSGTLLLQPDDNITTNWETHDFDIKAEGFAAVPITISSSQSGGYLLNIKAALPDGADVVETAPLETAVLCTHPGAVVGVETEQKLIIENDFFLATALQKGGRVKVWDKVGNKEQMFFREEVGPPFDPHDLEQKLYDLSLHRHDGSLTAVFRVNSDRFAGLAVTRELLFTPTPTMRVTHRLQNNGDQPITCTIMTRLGMNDTNHGNGRSYIPYPDRLVSDFTSKYPVQFEDFPEKPEDTTEQWAVFTVDEQVHGVVWTTASKHNLRWGLIDIHSREVNLNAGEQIVLEPVYPYCGSGSWEDVRRLWQRIANQPDKTQPTPQPPYDITL
ncbi:MAG: GNAT family N-acetyltransferase, partial [Anaerolineales bacterium]|nr:GNAT family N-acetyltransferase [Anaerolineales bacterium]